MGYIDDVDEVFVNGQKIGFTGTFPPHFQTAYNSRRMYYLPNEILKKGQPNVIAVRVFDTILDGGILSGTIGIFTTKDPLPPIQRLEGLWKIREHRSPEWRELSYDDSRWDDTMVPGFWREMKSRSPRTSIATYRKEFELANYLNPNEELVVILGQIDDFDEVYLNGELIGKTKDYRPFGQSNSWREYRIYALPERLLNPNGKNVLTVEVEDLGGNAGIFKGPLVITYASEYRRVIRMSEDQW